MKKFSIVALLLALVVSLAACGCMKTPETSNTTDMQPSTNMTILPHMDTTIGPNIPDPDVDTSMPIYTEGTDTTGGTEMTDDTGLTGNTNRRR